MLRQAKWLAALDSQDVSVSGSCRIKVWHCYCQVVEAPNWRRWCSGEPPPDNDLHAGGGRWIAKGRQGAVAAVQGEPPDTQLRTRRGLWHAFAATCVACKSKPTTNLQSPTPASPHWRVVC
jgi:hypothetical protein